MDTEYKNKIDKLEQLINKLSDKIDAKEQRQLNYPIDPISVSALTDALKNKFTSFSSSATWGKVNLVSGTKTITDSRIKSTSTVLLTGDTSGTTDLLYAYPVTAGSVVIGSNGTGTFGVYYLIIF